MQMCLPLKPEFLDNRFNGRSTSGWNQHSSELVKVKNNRHPHFREREPDVEPKVDNLWSVCAISVLYLIYTKGEMWYLGILWSIIESMAK